MPDGCGRYPEGTPWPPSSFLYNVNSIRSRLPHRPGLAEAHRPVRALPAGTKVGDDQFPPPHPLRGLRGPPPPGGEAYKPRGHLSPATPPKGCPRLPDGGPPDGDRFIAPSSGNPVSTLVPQGRSARRSIFAYKIDWSKARAFSPHLHPVSPLLWCGDLNVAPEASTSTTPRGSWTRLLHPRVWEASPPELPGADGSLPAPPPGEAGRYTFSTTGCQRRETGPGLALSTTSWPRAPLAGAPWPADRSRPLLGRSPRPHDPLRDLDVAT
jgi:hypothetical protein